MNMRLILLVIAPMFTSCSEQSISEDEKKIDNVIARQLAEDAITYEKNMYQECMKMPGLRWGAGAEHKCSCVKDSVIPNLKATLEQAKKNANGSFEKFNSMDWNNLLAENVTKKSFKDCGFKY